jgi:hypothetical protein
MVTIQYLIRKHERDLALFREHLAVLTTRRGPPQFIGDLRRRIAAAQRSIAILLAAR